ncbi:MAG: hypothetical protein AAGF04_04950 [Chlamydiota bacterium]
MRFASYFVLYGKLQTLPEERQQSLLHYLGEEHIEQLRSNHTKDVAFSPASFSLSSLLRDVHYSWFVSFLQQQDAPHLFFPLFRERTGKKLAKALDIPWTLPKLSPCFSRYLVQILEESLFHERATLPMEYMQKMPLFPLLTKTKKELVALIHHLSLFDIAIEMRQLVEQRRLQELSDSLGEGDQAIIAEISKALPPPLFPRTAYRDFPSFQQEMHKRGIVRLGIALLQTNKDFLWHITRRLDEGRGTLLLQTYEKKALAKHTQDMVSSVLGILQGHL